MIARIWRGQATAEQAADYLRHFTTAVVPNLQSIEGHRGACLLRREVVGMAGSDVEFVAVTLWDSIDTIRAFSGHDPEAAHIEPEGRAALSAFDEFARNYEIACSTLAIHSP